MWAVADQSNPLRGYMHRVAACVPSGNVGVFSQGFATKAKSKTCDSECVDRSKRHVLQKLPVGIGEISMGAVAFMLARQREECDMTNSLLLRLMLHKVNM